MIHVIFHRLKSKFDLYAVDVSEGVKSAALKGTDLLISTE